MSLVPAQEEVKKYLLNKGIDYKEGTTLIACYMPLRGTSTATAMSMRYMAINFSEKGIALIGMNQLTCKLEEDQSCFILKENITNLVLKKKMLHYQLLLEFSDGKRLILRLNKKILGAKWQGANLARVVENINK